MKNFRRYVFPGVYGLILYFTIRLLQDTGDGVKFWKRSFSLNAIEISFSILAGYLTIFIFGKLFAYFDRRNSDKLEELFQHLDRRSFKGLDYKSIIREVIILGSSNLLLVNLILTPMVALTDDGLSLSDFTDINTIPTFYAVIYYGLRRSRSYLKAYVGKQIQLQTLANSHLETELKFLKAQYHPHFLFNALNTIYFQMDDDPLGAKKSIEKFSQLLRYQLYDAHQMVPVSSELEYLTAYMELMKSRMNNKLRLTVNFDPDLKHQLIYPLLMLPLVENAFKFVDGEFLIDIVADIRGSYILFKIKNSISENTKVESHRGIGLESFKRRLNLLYENKSELSITSDKAFTVELKLAYDKANSLCDNG